MARGDRAACERPVGIRGYRGLATLLVCAPDVSWPGHLSGAAGYRGCLNGHPKPLGYKAGEVNGVGLGRPRARGGADFAWYKKRVLDHSPKARAGKPEYVEYVI